MSLLAQQDGRSVRKLTTGGGEGDDDNKRQYTTEYNCMEYKRRAWEHGTCVTKMSAIGNAKKKEEASVVCIINKKANKLSYILTTEYFENI